MRIFSRISLGTLVFMAGVLAGVAKVETEFFVYAGVAIVTIELLLAVE